MNHHDEKKQPADQAYPSIATAANPYADPSPFANTYPAKDGQFPPPPPPPDKTESKGDGFGEDVVLGGVATVAWMPAFEN